MSSKLWMLMGEKKKSLDCCFTLWDTYNCLERGGEDVAVLYLLRNFSLSFFEPVLGLFFYHYYLLSNIMGSGPIISPLTGKVTHLCLVLCLLSVRPGCTSLCVCVCVCVRFILVCQHDSTLIVYTCCVTLHRFQARNKCFKKRQLPKHSSIYPHRGKNSLCSIWCVWKIMFYFCTFLCYEWRNFETHIALNIQSCFWRWSLSFPVFAIGRW